VGASRRQICVILSDASPSMEEGNKATEALAGRTALAGVLAHPDNRDAFDVIHIGFGATARVLVAKKAVTKLKPSELDCAIGRFGGRTNIVQALTVAGEVLDRAAREPGVWARPVCVLFTDGNANEGGDPGPAADALKAVATIVCAGFGADADIAMLKRIATSPDMTLACPDGVALRRFFEVVGRSMSQAAATGRPAAALLGDALLKG